MLILGILLVIGGGAALFWGGKMRFEKTNETGTEVYESYGQAVANRAASGFLLVAGRIAVIGGIGIALLGAAIGK